MKLITYNKKQQLKTKKEKEIKYKKKIKKLYYIKYK